MDTSWKSRKVVIVGAGAVGSTFAYALAQKGQADEICLLDVNRELAEGQVLDLAHGLPYYPPVDIRLGQEADYADAQVVVITAGAKQKPDEARLALLKRNAALVEGVVDGIAAQKSQAVIVVATNPVDVLTDIALKRSGWSRERVIGSGTVLDSARFRYLLSRRCGVDVGSVHAYILGEHGDSEFAAWSLTHVGGVPIGEYAPFDRKGQAGELERENVVRQVRESAYHIINYKGATYFAIGMALVRIVGAILQDQNSLLTVSALLEGEYGLRQVCLGVPCVVGQGGVKRIVEARLPEAEQAALEKSAAALLAARKELAEDKQAG